jgi:type I restriction enzyme, S subunit
MDIRQRELPSGWKWLQIEDVCIVILGQSPSGSTYRKTPAGLPFFQGKTDFGDVSPQANTWCVEPKKIADPGDILISVRAPVGPTNVADTRCCIGRGLAALRCNELADRDFVLAGLKLFETNIADMGSGSTFHAITGKQLREIPIPFPPIEEQKRIARILSEQMAAVKQAMKAAQERLDAAQALSNAYLRGAFPSRENTLPDGWEWVKLGDVSNLITKGTTPTTFGADYVSKGIPFIRAMDVHGGAIDANLVEFHIDVTTHHILRRSQIIPGDLLITIAGTLGRASYCPDDSPPMNCNQAVAIIRLEPKVADSEYVCWVCQSPQLIQSLIQQKAGGAIQNLNLQQIGGFIIPLPPLEDQKRIAAQLNRKTSGAKLAKESIRQELNFIEAIPSALLRKAFRGGL